MRKNPISYSAATLITGYIAGTVFGTFKSSDQIFKSIPPLKDKEMEEERQDVLKYCFAVDLELIARSFIEETL
jgi:hypothetical protein